MPNNKHTISVDFVVEPGRETDVIPLFTASVFKQRPRCRSLWMPRIPEASPSISFWLEGTPDFLCIREFDGFGSFIKVTGSYEEYRQRLDPRFNRNIRRLERKVDCLDNAKFEFLNSADCVERCLERFVHVEASSWKSQVGTAILNNSRLKNFYETLCHRLAASGWLEWHFLDIGDQTVAGQLAIKFSRKLVIFKIGYDDSYSSYSPGNVLFAKVIEHAFTSGDIDEIDCLSYYAWNENWRMERRPYFNLRLCSRHFPGIVTTAAPFKILSLVRSSPVVQRLYRSLKFSRDGMVNNAEGSGCKLRQESLNAQP